MKTYVYTTYVYTKTHTQMFQKLEITQIFFKRWMVKQTVVNPYYWVLLSNKKEQTTDTRSNLGGYQGSYAK